jgi:hypothetical protein
MAKMQTAVSLPPVALHGRRVLRVGSQTPIKTLDHFVALICVVHIIVNQFLAQYSCIDLIIILSEHSTPTEIRKIDYS